MEVNLIDLLGVIVVFINVWGLFLVKSLLARLKEIEQTHKADVTRLDNKLNASEAKQRDRLEEYQKEMYKHHDTQADKFRNDLSDMGNALRNEISATNGLIMNLITELQSSSKS